MKNIEITLQQLFDFLDTSELSYNEIKAVNEDIYILTPDNSYAKLRGVIKKQDEKLKIKCGDIEFICGERHILISEEGNEVFAKDATYIMSIDGPLEITEKTKVEYGDVFDVSIDAPHLYMTPNGIVHHNTTAAFALCNELDADVLFINASMESGIDVLRSKIQSFASTVSFGGGTKIVILDEADGLNCLEENETVRIGTVEDWSAIPLKDLDPNLEHSVVSFNMETGKFENDTATVISNSSKETFELELETGETVIVTGDHPFIVTQDEKTFIERTINEGLEEYKIVCY